MPAIVHEPNYCETCCSVWENVLQKGADDHDRTRIQCCYLFEDIEFRFEAIYWPRSALSWRRTFLSLRRFAHFLCPAHLTEHGAKLYCAYLRHIGPAQTDVVVRSRDAEGSRNPASLGRRTSWNAVKAKFAESVFPGTSVNRGKKKGQSCYAPALH